LKKSDLIIKFAEQNDITVKDAERVINIIIKEISSTLAKSQRAEFRGFGVFSPSIREEKTARNPKSGEKIVTSKKIIPTFRMAKGFFDKLNR
tara:strand:- start:599 stop:874 length:276 start_codon:yes stop_codon:yes gene_type:complete